MLEKSKSLNNISDPNSVKTDNDLSNATLRKTSSLKSVNDSNQQQGTVNNSQMISKSVDNTEKVVSELTEHNPEKLEQSSELFTSMSGQKLSKESNNTQELSVPNLETSLPKKLNSKSKENVSFFQLVGDTGQQNSSVTNIKQKLALDRTDDQPLTLKNDDFIYGNDPELAPAFKKFSNSILSYENVKTLNDIRKFYQDNGDNPSPAQIKTFFAENIAPVFEDLNFGSKGTVKSVMTSESATPEDINDAMNTIISGLKQNAGETCSKFVASQDYKDALLSKAGITDDITTRNFKLQKVDKPIQDQIGILSNHEKNLRTTKDELEKNVQDLETSGAPETELNVAKSELLIVSNQLAFTTEKKQTLLSSLMPDNPISTPDGFNDLATHLKSKLDISKNDNFNTQALQALRTLSTNLNEPDVDRVQVIKDARKEIQSYAVTHPNSKKHDVATELTHQLNASIPAFETKDKISQDIITVFNKDSHVSNFEQLKSYNNLIEGFRGVEDNSEWSENIGKTLKNENPQLIPVFINCVEDLKIEYKEANKLQGPEKKERLLEIMGKADSIRKSFNKISDFGDYGQLKANKEFQASEQSVANIWQSIDMIKDKL
jgi:hypothetical protein